MSPQKFRKLEIDLRTQSFDQRPWLVTGLLLAFIFLLMSAYAYFEHLKKRDFQVQQKQNTPQ